MDVQASLGKKQYSTPKITEAKSVGLIAQEVEWEAPSSNPSTTTKKQNKIKPRIYYHY
jgi:hypothetical protein